MKKFNYFKCAWIVLFILMFIALIQMCSSCTSLQDVQNYVKDNPAVLTDLCPKPIERVTRDTVKLPADTIIFIEYLEAEPNDNAILAGMIDSGKQKTKIITKYITQKVLIVDTVQIIDSIALNKAYESGNDFGFHKGYEAKAAEFNWSTALAWFFGVIALLLLIVVAVMRWVRRK